MTNALVTLALLGLSFGLGAIPTGYLLLKAVKHQDIREIGSGNIGSTNVRRAAGEWLSLLTQFIDILKGLIPVAMALAISNHFEWESKKPVLLSAVALASILGHDFSPFLRFRGGKGVNTTAGAFVLLAPIPVVSAALVFYILRAVTPIVSLRSLALGFTIAVMATLLRFPPSVAAASWIAASLILLRHVPNIRRLIERKEPT